MKKFSTPVKLEDYHYNLPEDRIAGHPLTNRSDSKLLLYQSGEISHHRFFNLPDLLPLNSLIFFNNTRVIPARLIFHRESGAAIEIFLLHPATETIPLEQAMSSVSPVVWSCMIGNKRKWKNGEILKERRHDGLELRAEWADRNSDKVRFMWNTIGNSFSQAISSIGSVPLPPYIKRMPVKEDAERYQTVYSEKQGAVAAPTAGLHFTNELINQLREKSVVDDYLTLHVSAGTFQPVKEKNVIDHPMHNEQIEITIENVNRLLLGKKTIAIGTTALRTLESLYWFGVKILLERKHDFRIEKLLPYRYDDSSLPNMREAVGAVKELMELNGVTRITGETEIFILPGYRFKVCEGLITNFHMPRSTLILLVAAFIGKDWKKVYNEALSNDYRFLSYGDGSLLLK